MPGPYSSRPDVDLAPARVQGRGRITQLAELVIHRLNSAITSSRPRGLHQFRDQRTQLLYRDREGSQLDRCRTPPHDQHQPAKIKSHATLCVRVRRRIRVVPGSGLSRGADEVELLECAESVGNSPGGRSRCESPLGQ